MASPHLTIPIPLQRRDNRRGAERFVAAMPVSIDGQEGTTQDLSSTGLSFTADRPYEVGAHIDVLIEYLLDGHQYPLRCQAEVVRVERTETGYTIGARLTPQAVEEVDVASADGVTPAAGTARLRSID
jgi:hypothetical protein